ncbi:carbamoyltransferase HypF [Sulfitobacter pacificus]
MHPSGMQIWQIRVWGLVQGVGFRPTVWRIATDAGLAGEVLNDADGVLIRLACTQDQLDRFTRDLRQQAPPLSRIDGIEISVGSNQAAIEGFVIVPSKSGTARTGIVPDAATCADCLADINDPKNRRFGYAFTNCTNCGPRLSIIRAIPYDRPNTAMAAFAMCAACQQEYDDPADRRFHAQPNACPDCGPALLLVDGEGEPLPGDPIEAAALALSEGKILAVKGLGGFQLACDATNPKAVALLRARKRRAAKPFALMGKDLEQIGAFAELTEATKAALTSAQAPIVLARARQDGTPLATGIAPGQNRLGFMLPNTPLHHLLLNRVNGPLVMTSGNLSSEPQVTGNAEALARLDGIADAWLLHNRKIVNRLDDSVVQIVGEAPLVLRRARGAAPAPLQLHPGFAKAAPVLACGADLKNTFCLLKDGQAIVSQHMGDMENDRTHRDFSANLALFSKTHDFTAAAIAVDTHPGYFASRIGREFATERKAPLIEVQHHHAHIAAELAEHGYGPETPQVLGIVLDGLGYGNDGTIWGGEFLLADFQRFHRLAHFAPIALPGGEKANIQPWRNTFAHLMAVFGPDPLVKIEQKFGALPVLSDLKSKPLATVEQMIDRGLNAPLASSAGRLFDAVAGVLGLCFDQIEFEGQAAMYLQRLAEERPDEAGLYLIEPSPVIHWHSLWTGVLSDLKGGIEPATIAAKFHNSLIALIADLGSKLSETHSTSTIVLSGGVFQNAVLLNGVEKLLTAQGRDVLVPRQFPINDGGVSLGQATIAAALGV